MTLKAAWMMDTVGNKRRAPRSPSSRWSCRHGRAHVIDRAIQVHGGAGVSAETPLAGMWAALRTLRLADGPDEVHLRSLAREELRKLS